MLYRLGTDASENWSAATLADGTEAKVFDKGYGGSNTKVPGEAEDWPGGERLKLDISYTKDGYIYVYPYNNEESKREFILRDWNTSDADWTANLPIRFLLPYNKKPISYVADDGKFKHAKYITIHELKVYDDTYDKNLVADLVPAYGNYEGTWTVFLYDKVGEHEMYPFTIPAESLRKVHFYSKK